MSHCAGKNFKLNTEYDRAAQSQYIDQEEDHYDPDEEDEMMLQLEENGFYLQDSGTKLSLNKRQKSLVVGNQKNGEEKLLMSQQLLPKSLFQNNYLNQLMPNGPIEDTAPNY